MPIFAAFSDGPPWWTFLFMPLMMLGMALMMWFMMRMMMGHGSGHDMASSSRSHGDPQPGELETLRAEVAQLHERLAAIESNGGESPDGDKGSPDETQSTSDRRTESP